MHHHKQETIAYQTEQAIRFLNSGQRHSAMTFVCSMEQTAFHCGIKEIKYLAPKAYLLILCGYDFEALKVLHQILEGCSTIPQDPRSRGHSI